MKVIFLGTNGWYSSPTGDTACILIDSRDHYVILDAGNGIYKLDQCITEDKPISMFISHFHLDHVSGLHILNKFDFKQGIDVYVGEGRSKDFKTIVNPPFTVGYLSKPENKLKLKTEIRLNELSENEEDVPFKAQAIKQSHLFGDHGFRIELEGKTVSYTGDCEITDATRKLAKKADLLICDCTNKKKVSNDTGHMDPVEVATLAEKEGVGQLILTHFHPLIYPTIEDRKWAEDEAKKTFPATTAAIDGMEFTL